jgi:ribosomal protein S18 acetylase RimI-like enzyme
MDITNPVAHHIKDLLRVNRANGAVAQHAEYLFWLCCTIYRSRCFVACERTAGIVGYLLSIPDSERDAEFLLQIAVLKEWRKHSTGRLLLANHWQSIREARIRRVRTSIHESSREGMALLRIARGMGHKYHRIDWQITSTPVPSFAGEEQLFEAIP